MRRLFILALLLLALVTLFLAVGCDDDDDTVTGSTDDPRLEAFDMIFGQVEMGTQQMVGLPLMFMDSIMTEGLGLGKGRSHSLQGFHNYTLTWHEASQYWYCTAELIDDYTTVSVIDSIQFRYASGPVKYPLSLPS